MATLPKKQFRMGRKKKGVRKVHERSAKNTERVKGVTPTQKPNKVFRPFGRGTGMAGRPRGTVKGRLFRYATYRGNSLYTPEQKLWSGVLGQAVSDLKRHTPCFIKRGMGWQVNSQVTEWFKSDSDECGSFIWVCDYLNIDYKTVRQKLGVSV